MQAATASAVCRDDSLKALTISESVPSTYYFSMKNSFSNVAILIFLIFLMSFVQSPVTGGIIQADLKKKVILLLNAIIIKKTAT